MPAVSVIVPARDAAATLGSLLDGLAAQDLSEDFEVIVVDDGSRDTTPDLARGHHAVTTVLRHDGLGPGAARNLGARAATAPILAFTDADCIPEPSWLRHGLAAVEAGGDVVQGAVLPPSDAVPDPLDRTVLVGRLSHLFETANMFLRREVFDGIGGFQPWLRPRRDGKELAEDVWLGWRAKRAGARVAFEPRALVRHAVEPRGPCAFVGERTRLRFFPAIARRVPELREAFFYRRLFLNPRTARFDLALAAAFTALACRRVLPLAAALPYARLALREARGWEKRGFAEVLGAQVAADAVGFGALLWGSLRERSPLL